MGLIITIGILKNIQMQKPGLIIHIIHLYPFYSIPVLSDSFFIFGCFLESFYYISGTGGIIEFL